MEEQNGQSFPYNKEGIEFLSNLEKMHPDARVAIEKLIVWMVEHPNDSKLMSETQMNDKLEEFRLEHIRRRLGGIVGKVLPFKAKE